MVTACCCWPGYAQNSPEAEARQLFERERWPELTRLLENAPRTSADLNYYYGVALAHQQRWDEAANALMAGERLASRDKRFPLELSGVRFRQKKFGAAKRYLNRALGLDPKDTYANDFLATVYFLEGNLEAALKYWNRVGKPEIAEVRNEPALRVRPALLDHAMAFAPASILTLDELLASEARIRGLDIFSSDRLELNAHPDGKFDVVFHAQELNGFGDTKAQALARALRGIFFQEITPEYYNLRGSATNITSLVRWDPDKRRAYAWLSGLLAGNPKWRYRLGADLRNENWSIQTAFTGPSTFLGALNLRRESASVEIIRLAGARWRWSNGVEVSHRDYRSVFAGAALTPHLLAQGYQVKETARLNYQLWRSAEHRLTISTGGSVEGARLWSQPAESFARLQGMMETHWLPRARGDDYETRWRLRAGKTFGDLPFDELLMLGVERDNDLWLRAHVGTRHGQKGSAPLGRDYLLSNWETDKSVYSNGFLTVKLGPLLDIGKIANPSSTLGPHKWLFDAGAQTKLRVLGVGVAFSYGKDLRSGNNAFYATVER
jgi:tetratricopeptide (TPR) repeat protein